jgi:hypothetical protein
LLLLREERLLELLLRLLLPLALGLLLRVELEPLRLLLLLPLEAVPRLLPLLLREEDEPDFDEEEEEELRDAIACSFGGLMSRPSTSDAARPPGQSRQTRRGACRYAHCFRVGIALPAGDPPDDEGCALLRVPAPYQTRTLPSTGAL